MVTQLLDQKFANVGPTFSGYSDKKASESRIEHNCFEEGDKFFKTGDVLKQDEAGYWYFVDRIGDTFRWKGENVSTMEVSGELSKFGGKLELNVFGVSIPNYDGRAGMACISNIDPNSFPFEEFLQFAKEKLPAYSIPLFIRIVTEMQVTSTFKHIKYEYKKEGFDPTVVNDPLFFNNGKTFLPLTEQLYNTIVSGTLKL